jgi:hypothetical protein
MGTATGTSGGTISVVAAANTTSGRSGTITAQLT